MKWYGFIVKSQCPGVRVCDARRADTGQGPQGGGTTPAPLSARLLSETRRPVRSPSRSCPLRAQLSSAITARISRGAACRDSLLITLGLPILASSAMDELPPKTPMTPGVGPRFGLEEETLRRQHRADRRELRRDVYRRGAALARQGGEETAKESVEPLLEEGQILRGGRRARRGLRHASSFRRRHRDDSYDEEDELAALQKRIHQGGARAVRPERTMQPWEARLRRLVGGRGAASATAGETQEEDPRRPPEVRGGQLPDGEAPQGRAQPRVARARGPDGGRVAREPGSHDGDVRAHLAMTRAADNATSIPEAAMLVAPPIEFLHPQGLPPQHLLVPVRNHHPPEWVRPTGKSPLPH